MDFFYSLESILKGFAPQLTALMALIAADVILGIAAAIKRKTFEWDWLADFYRTMVVPLLLGWLAFGILAHFAGPEILGPEYGKLAASGVTWLAWLAVVGQIGGSIVKNAKGIYEKLPF